MSKNILRILTIACLFAQETFAANSDNIDTKIRLMQAQINDLQKQINITKATQDNNYTDKANVSLGENGLLITSQDNQYSLRIGGFIKADGRYYLNDKSNNTNTNIIRSARTYIEATYPENFSSKFVGEFANGNARLIDGYLDYKNSSYLALRVGKIKTPLGIERGQDETSVFFVERGLSTNLVPFRDIGLLAYGNLYSPLFSYQVGITNGTADLGDSNGETNGNDKDVVAKIFIEPFKLSKNPNLKGIGFGVAGSYGDRNGNTTNTGLSSSYLTTSQVKFFSYASGVYADGAAYRFNPQLWYYNRQFGLLAEYVDSKVRLTKEMATADITNSAWNIVVTYVLTGEDASYNGVKPFENFSYSKGKLGAFELTGRFGRLIIDNKAFANGFANEASSASSDIEKVIGLNWYLNNQVRLNLNYANNSFNQGALGGKDRPDEDAILTEFQFKF